MYWERGDQRRIYFGARNWLYALDATTGKPVATFGRAGPHRPAPKASRAATRRTISIGVNTPGVFYGDLLILGSVVPEGLPSAPGDIRAFDVNTGRREVGVSTRFPHPGELGYDTWPKDAWKYSGGANAWSGVSLDEKRGLVYAATGSTSYDFYGANRHGDNLFANSILCLQRGDRRARLALPGREARRLGPRLPRAADPRHDHEGRQAAATSSRRSAKNGRTYVLDRETGEPDLPDGDELTRAGRPTCPASRLAPTQLLPTLPPPFTRQQFTEDLITEAHARSRAGRC